MNTTTMPRRRRVDHTARPGESLVNRLAHVARAALRLLDRRKQEDRVVHRQREDEGEEKDRRPRVHEALGLKSQQPVERSILEHEPRDAERRRRGEQVESDGRRGGEWRAQQRDQEQEPQAHDDAD
jgi:hypothetical protein